MAPLTDFVKQPLFCLHFKKFCSFPHVMCPQTLAEPQPPRTAQTHLTPSHVRGRGHACSLAGHRLSSSEVACDICTCPYSTAVGKRQMTSWQILTSSESRGSCYIKVPVMCPVVKRVIEAAGQA